MEGFNSFDLWAKKTYGRKLYRLALDGGFTCPNRDGTLDTRGCAFCSAGGSGDFAEARQGSVQEQLERAKLRVAKKAAGCGFVAYFQSYTGTYAPIDYLERLYTEAVGCPDTAALDIATRPDCLGDEVIALLEGLNRVKPVWVELGLQTSNEETARRVRRGYPLRVYDEAVARLRGKVSHVVAHMIVGLPGEGRADFEATARHIADSGAEGIKIQLLHVLRGAGLAADWAAGRFRTLELDEYVDIVTGLLELLPPELVVHRLTGDGAKRELIAPLWSADKKRVLKPSPAPYGSGAWYRVAGRAASKEPLNKSPHAP